MKYLNYNVAYINRIKELEAKGKKEWNCKELASLSDYVYGTNFIGDYWD